MGRIRFSLGCVAFALLLAACSPNNKTSVSSPAGFSVFLTVTPNSIPAIQAGSTADKGGCATLIAKVFDGQGRLVDGAIVLFNTSLGIFPKRTGENEDAVARFDFTLNGIATDVICAQAVKGTAIVTSTVEDAHATVLVTIF